MFIDTHAHLMLPDFTEDLAEVLDRAVNVGVNKIINAGCSIETSKKSLEYAEKFDMLYATLGVHPYDASDVNDKLMRTYSDIISLNKKVVAIGETGLDYHKNGSLTEVQKEAFKKHLDLAKSFDLPIIIHCRNSQNDVLDLLDMFSGVRGVIHCFSYDIEYAMEIWNRGIFTSFTGIVTQPNVKHLLEVLKSAPQDMIMIETDSPYLMPQNCSKKRNEPSCVIEIAKQIAFARAISIDEVAHITTNNALKLFNGLTVI